MDVLNISTLKIKDILQRQTALIKFLLKNDDAIKFKWLLAPLPSFLGYSKTSSMQYNTSSVVIFDTVYVDPLIVLEKNWHIVFTDIICYLNDMQEDNSNNKLYCGIYDFSVFIRHVADNTFTLSPLIKYAGMHEDYYLGCVNKSKTHMNIVSYMNNYK